MDKKNVVIIISLVFIVLLFFWFTNKSQFMKKDSRIKLHLQEHNIGQFKNFNFVLEQSQGKYFVWVAADDLWLPKFLEKNFNILEMKKNVVTSVSKLKMFGEFKDSMKKNKKYHKLFLIKET